MVGQDLELEKNEQIKLTGPEPLAWEIKRTEPKIMVNKATRPTNNLIGQDLWNIQLDDSGNLKHFLTIEGLGTDVLQQNSRHRRKFCRRQ